MSSMASDPCSLQYCPVSTEELALVSILSALHIGYLVFTHVRRTRARHFLAVRAFAVVYLVGRLVSLYFEQLPRGVYAFFVSLLPIGLFCGGLQWASQVLMVCRQNAHLAEDWMKRYIKYKRACQVVSAILFPAILVGAQGGLAFTCNPGSLAFVFTLTAYMYMMGVPLLYSHRSIRRVVTQLLDTRLNKSDDRRRRSLKRTLKRIRRVSVGVAVLMVGWTVFVGAQFIEVGGEANCGADLPLALLLQVLMAFFLFLLIWHTDVVPGREGRNKNSTDSGSGNNNNCKVTTVGSFETQNEKQSRANSLSTAARSSVSVVDRHQPHRSGLLRLQQSPRSISSVGGGSGARGSGSVIDSGSGARGSSSVIDSGSGARGSGSVIDRGAEVGSGDIGGSHAHVIQIGSSEDGAVRESAPGEASPIPTGVVHTASDSPARMPPSGNRPPSALPATSEDDSSADSSGDSSRDSSRDSSGGSSIELTSAERMLEEPSTDADADGGSSDADADLERRRLEGYSPAERFLENPALAAAEAEHTDFTALSEDWHKLRTLPTSS